jgi:hypothetical protein
VKSFARKDSVRKIRRRVKMEKLKKKRMMKKSLLSRKTRRIRRIKNEVVTLNCLSKILTYDGLLYFTN